MRKVRASGTVRRLLLPLCFAWTFAFQLGTRLDTETVTGKVGVWSKTDSISEFADYTVTPAGQ